MEFYTDALDALGPKQATLPSGSLLCLGVPIGRIGEQDYDATEIGGDVPGMVTVLRDASEVFNPRSMGSFEGVPVTMRHPADVVDPSNWRALSVGHVQNVRRDGDMLIADLLIHDQRGIEAIRKRGWRGVSCGYDASYEPIGRGRLRQIGITGNHVAILAPGEAPRCGETCMIGDSASNRRETSMGSVMAMSETEFDAMLAKAFPKRKPKRKPKRTRDQQEGTSAIPTTWSASRIDPNDGRRVDMGKRPGSQSGAEPYLKLGGELGQWFIGKSDDGKVTLYRHVSANNAIKGVTKTADRMALMRAREATDQAASRSAAAQVRDFWARQANG